MKAPFLFFYFSLLQRKSWCLHLSERRVEPLARALHAGLTLVGPRIGPRPLEALRKPLGRLTRSRRTEGTLAARPAAWAAP